MSTHSKRVEMTAALASRRREPVLGARRPRADDLQELARLMFAAYQGTIDYTGESVEDAAGELTKTLAGAHGLYLPQYSYVVELGTTLVSASLVTRREGLPLLAFAMTGPDWKRKGLARATIGNAMQDLFEAGETRLELVVNAKNLPAYDLYISLGFEPTAGDA